MPWLCSTWLADVCPIRRSQGVWWAVGIVCHSIRRLLPASATHSPCAAELVVDGVAASADGVAGGKQMACGQRMLAAVGVPPAFSSRCSK